MMMKSINIIIIVPAVPLRSCAAGVPRGILKHAGQDRSNAERDCIPVGGLLQAVQTESGLSLLDVV